MTIYYTYCSYETDKGTKSLYYIGSRKCPEGKTPETDNYFGTPTSPKNLDFKNNPNKDKVILGVFDTKEEALAHEIWLHDLHDVAVNPTFANQAKQTSTGFSRVGIQPHNKGKKGKKLSLAHRQKISDSNRGERSHMKGRMVLTNGKEIEIFPKGGIPEGWFGVSKGKTSGENHYRYRGDRGNWYHPESGKTEHNVTPREMSEKYSLKSSHLFKVMDGKRKQSYGWILLEEESG